MNGVRLNEFLFLLTGLKWTVLLSSIGFVGGGIVGSAASRSLRTSGSAALRARHCPAISRSSRARRC